MVKNIVQNREDIIEGVVNTQAQTSAQEIFEAIIQLDKYNHIATDIANCLDGELSNQSFMTIDLELTQHQKDALHNCVFTVVKNVINKYVGQVKKDERTKEICEIIEHNCKNIIELALSSIAQEINRGAIINSVAVSADTKNDKYNKIELNHSKASGDITIPTRGVFLSTNCLDLIKKSIEIEIVDRKTGEILEETPNE